MSLQVRAPHLHSIGGQDFSKSVLRILIRLFCSRIRILRRFWPGNSTAPGGGHVVSKEITFIIPSPTYLGPFLQFQKDAKV